MQPNTIIEPFRIKAIEPIPFTTQGERREILARAGYNLFAIEARDVLIDLLTDSGTGAMSAAQWGALMQGDESYAGSKSFYRLEQVVRDLTGHRFVLPTHQGRAAERILFSLLARPGKVFLANSHFDTTRANIEYSGAEARDLLPAEARVPAAVLPFKGNIDLAALEQNLESLGANYVPLIILTVTNNTAGGQPVSLENIRGARRLADRHGVPLFLDCARFAENAYFIKTREPDQADRSVREISREMFSLADGAWMSAKKDGLVNMGGFLTVNDPDLAAKARNLLILTEGFPTYGGMAGRDLEALATGLEEAQDEHYLRYRVRSIAYLAEALQKIGIPLLLPPGGHAVYLDAKSFLPHIPPHEFPGQALACALYLEGGIRGVEVGSVMFGKTGDDGREVPAAQELVRLAFPRRVYTQSHVDYVAEVLASLHERRDAIRGVRVVEQPPFLRHFTARFEPLQ
ncbi:MAG: tryptophanase [Candidatus Sericytochromatia bacterium]|nr:tryptophanase [Candidatus Tanganyikabacteria bacterium]